MSTESAAAEVPELDERPRLLALEVGGWPALGRKVRLELSSQRTVLVGKNAAGKSLLLEGIFQAVNKIWSPFPDQTSAPRYFRCDVERPGASPIAYEYSIRQDDVAENVDMPPGDAYRVRLPSWTERCWGPLDNTELWRIADSALIIPTREPMPFLPGMSLIASESPSTPKPVEADQIVKLLFGLRFVPAGIPRSEDLQRREILIGGQLGRRKSRPFGLMGRIEFMAYQLLSISKYRREYYDEFVEIVRRLGLVQHVTIKTYTPDAQPTSEGEGGQDFMSVLFDGLNIGLQSDGTLRIAEIVLNLITPDSSVILIEEPETAVHPGLLSRLLALMESYSFDRQLIISTHSPIVVDWCKPQQLRLVERVGKETMVHALDHEDTQKVIEYLEDEGTFSDFIFGRAST